MLGTMHESRLMRGYHKNDPLGIPNFSCLTINSALSSRHCPWGRLLGPDGQLNNAWLAIVPSGSWKNNGVTSSYEIYLTPHQFRFDRKSFCSQPSQQKVLDHLNIPQFVALQAPSDKLRPAKLVLPEGKSPGTRRSTWSHPPNVYTRWTSENQTGWARDINRLTTKSEFDAKSG